MGLNKWLVQLRETESWESDREKSEMKKECYLNVWIIEIKPSTLRTGAMQTARKATGGYARVSMKLPPQFPSRAGNSEFGHVYAMMTLAGCSRRAIDRGSRWRKLPRAIPILSILFIRQIYDFSNTTLRFQIRWNHFLTFTSSICYTWRKCSEYHLCNRLII